MFFKTPFVLPICIILTFLASAALVITIILNIQRVPVSHRLPDDGLPDFSAAYTDDLDEWDDSSIGSPPVTSSPLIPVIWERAVFYDTSQGQIVIDKKKFCSFSLHSNNIFNEHTLIWEQMMDLHRQITIRDDYVADIIIDNSSLVITCSRPLFAKQTEDDEFIYIRFVDPKIVYDAIIVIDPGHGGIDAGTISGDIYEKDINLDIALRLAGQFKEDEGIHIILTRTEDVEVSLERRYKLANELADYFISIHNNADANSKQAHGTMVYYLGNEEDDWPVTPRDFAQAIQDGLVARLQTRDRGIMESEYRVLVNATVPAVIAEVAFMSNPGDFERLTDASFRERAAQGLYDGLMKMPMRSHNDDTLKR